MLRCGPSNPPFAAGAKSNRWRTGNLRDETDFGCGGSNGDFADGSVFLLDKTYFQVFELVRDSREAGTKLATPYLYNLLIPRTSHRPHRLPTSTGRAPVRSLTCHQPSVRMLARRVSPHPSDIARPG